MDKLIDDLLELHCKKCDGTLYGCTGCDEREFIKEVLKKYHNQIIYFEESGNKEKRVNELGI